MEEFHERNREQEHIDFAVAYGVFVMGLIVVAVICGVAQWLLK